MDAIQFVDEDGNIIELYVLEETTIAGKHYLLLVEDDAEETNAYIFREEPTDDPENEEQDAMYVPVEDETEYEAVQKIFEELLDDTDFE